MLSLLNIYYGQNIFVGNGDCYVALYKINFTDPLYTEDGIVWRTILYLVSSIELGLNS